MKATKPPSRDIERLTHEKKEFCELTWLTAVAMSKEHDTLVTINRELRNFCAEILAGKHDGIPAWMVKRASALLGKKGTI